MQGPKNSPHQLINAMMSCPDGDHNECNCGSTTVFSTTAHVDLSRPAQQGHRSPCRRQTVETPWSDEQSGPWETASAPRQENLHDHAQQGRRPPCQQLVNIYDLTKSLDHERLPLSRKREVNDLEKLQLRRLHSLRSLTMGTIT